MTPGLRAFSTLKASKFQLKRRKPFSLRGGITAGPVSHRWKWNARKIDQVLGFWEPRRDNVTLKLIVPWFSDVSPSGVDISAPSTARENCDKDGYTGDGTDNKVALEGWFWPMGLSSGPDGNEAVLLWPAGTEWRTQTRKWNQAQEIAIAKLIDLTAGVPILKWRSWDDVFCGQVGS